MFVISFHTLPDRRCRLADETARPLIDDDLDIRALQGSAPGWESRSDIKLTLTAPDC
jgi:hypothetical protein